MASIDFKTLRQRITLKDVVNLVKGLSNDLHEDSPRGPCPLSCHGDLRCCRYNWPGGLWYCHRCRQGGTALTLYMGYRGYTPHQAALELCLLLRVQVPWKPRAKAREPRKARVRKKKLADPEDDELD